MSKTTTQKQTMPLIQIREKAQITLPSKIRKMFDLKQGDYLAPSIVSDGILLSPKALYNKLPTVSLSRIGKKRLQESLKDLEQGHFKTFDNMEDLIADLHK